MSFQLIIAKKKDKDWTIVCTHTLASDMQRGVCVRVCVCVWYWCRLSVYRAVSQPQSNAQYSLPLPLPTQTNIRVLCRFPLPPFFSCAARNGVFYNSLFLLCPCVCVCVCATLLLELLRL